VFVFKPLYHSLSINGIMLLVGGGLAYTVGAVIYAIKPKFLKFKNFEFHEIFHLFIMLGSLLHFICVYVYVI
ncbi:MAG: hemolysin III family protein, partial [Peptostreptococcaceae bacterium]